MLIGDSITGGSYSVNGLGFRDDLFDLLSDLHYPFLFVGSRGESPYSGYFFAGAWIEGFYNGPGGYGYHDVGPEMDMWKTNIVMIHLGTNGVDDPHVTVKPYTNDGGTTLLGTTASGRLANLIAYLLKWKYGERGNHLRIVFVSKIIPKYALNNPPIIAYNEEIDRIYQDSQEGRIPKIPPGCLKLVEHYSQFDFDVMMSEDGIHPNEVGYTAMGEVSFDALRTLPMHLVLHSGDGQEGPLGTELPQPLVTCVTNDYGKTTSEVEVRYEVIDGDAVLLSPSHVFTDTSGLASARIQLGSEGTSTVVAISSGLVDSMVTFTVTATAYVHIDGVVTYHAHREPVPEVYVEWVEGGGVVDTTNNAGYFNFQEIPYGEEVTLLAQKSPLNGHSSVILSYDAALAARHAVGLKDLSYLKRLAADVDRDGRVSMNDAAQIARFAVGLDPSTNAYVGEWIFRPDSLCYGKLERNMSNQEFTGILLGDVHGKWSALSPIQRPFVSHWEINVSSLLPRGEEVVIPVEIWGENFLSGDMICQYDSSFLQFMGISKTPLTEEFYLFHHQEEETIRLCLFGVKMIPGGGTILELNFRMKGREEGCRIVFRDIYANDQLLSDYQVVFDGGCVLTHLGEFSIEQNFPNPFNEMTRIQYQLDHSSHIQLTVYNSLGQKVVDLWDGMQFQGNHQVLWNGYDQDGRMVPSGTYFYVLFSGDRRRVGRMGLIR